MPTLTPVTPNCAQPCWKHIREPSRVSAMPKQSFRYLYRTAREPLHLAEKVQACFRFVRSASVTAEDVVEHHPKLTELMLRRDTQTRLQLGICGFISCLCPCPSCPC